MTQSPRRGKRRVRDSRLTTPPDRLVLARCFQSNPHPRSETRPLDRDPACAIFAPRLRCRSRSTGGPTRWEAFSRPPADGLGERGRCGPALKTAAARGGAVTDRRCGPSRAADAWKRHAARSRPPPLSTPALLDHPNPTHCKRHPCPIIQIQTATATAAATAVMTKAHPKVCLFSLYGGGVNQGRTR